MPQIKQHKQTVSQDFVCHRWRHPVSHQIGRSPARLQFELTESQDLHEQSEGGLHGAKLGTPVWYSLIRLTCLMTALNILNCTHLFKHLSQRMMKTCIWRYWGVGSGLWFRSPTAWNVNSPNLQRSKLEEPSGQNSLPLVTVQIAQTPEQWSFPHPLRQNDESKLSTQSSILNPNQYPLDHCPRESRTEQE